MKTTLCVLVIFALYGLAIASSSGDASTVADGAVSKAKGEASNAGLPKDQDAGSQDGLGGLMHMPSRMMEGGAKMTKQIEDMFTGSLPGQSKSDKKETKDNN